jgi:polyhydroxyalkanoate synthesis regulator phasin
MYYTRMSIFAFLIVIVACVSGLAQDEVAVPSARCFAPVPQGQLAQAVGSNGALVELSPYMANNVPSTAIKLFARYQGGRLTVIVACSAAPQVYVQGDGSKIPVDYRFDEAVNVRTAASSQTSQDTLYKNLTKAVNDAVANGRLTNDQIQSAVDRVQSSLHTKLESALVEDVSRKLGTSNLLEQIATLSKAVADLQDQVKQLRSSPGAPAVPDPQTPAKPK